MQALLDLGIRSNGADGVIDKMENRLGGLANAANMAKTAMGGIMAGGLAMTLHSVLGVASDLQENVEKFGVVFQDVKSKAESFTNSLAKNFNFAKSAAIKSLADTGDILTGFGMSAGVALDLSNKVNRLAADLASFTNFAGGAAGASEALTKALLGEREQAKMLGLVITEETVKAQMALDARNGEVYSTEQAAKAYATYKVAISQSPNAIGDMARATEKYQFRLTALKNSFLTLKENIGTALIEPASKCIDKINGIVKALNDMDPATQKVVIRVAALAAGVTTLATALVGLRSAMGMAGGLDALSGKFGGTAAGTTGAVGAAGAAGTGGFKNLLKSIGTLNKAFGGLAKTLGRVVWPVVFVTASIGAMGTAFKNLPYLLEYVIQDLGPNLIEGLKNQWPNIKNGINSFFEWVYKFFNDAFKGLRDTFLRGGLILFKSITNLIAGKKIYGAGGEKDITTETQRKYEAKKRQKAIDAGNVFLQDAIDKENALASARKLAAETTNQTTKLLEQDMTRLAMTKDEREHAERQDSIDKAQSNVNTQLKSASSLAGNSKNISGLRQSQSSILSEAKSIFGDMVNENDLLGMLAGDAFSGLRVEGKGSLELKKVFAENEAKLKELQEAYNETDNQIRQLVNNSDPKKFMESANLMIQTLAQSAGDGSEVGKKYADLQDKFKQAAKTSDPEIFMGSATDFVTTLGQSAEAGSELGSSYQDILKEMAEARAQGNVEGFMQAMNKAFAAAAKDAGEGSSVAGQYKNLEELLKSAGSKFKANDFMKAIGDLQTKMLEGAIEDSKVNSNKLNEASKNALSNSEYTAEMTGGLSGINIRRDANKSRLGDLLDQQKKFSENNKNKEENQGRLSSLNNELADLQNQLASGEYKGTQEEYDENVKSITDEINVLIDAIANTRTPEEMQDLQDEINDTNKNLREVAQDRFNFDLGRLQDRASDNQFEAETDFNKRNLAFDRETKYGTNIDVDYTESAKSLQIAISQREKTLAWGIQAQIDEITRSLKTDDISEDERYKRERQIKELEQQKQGVHTDAESKQLNLTDTLNDRLKKQKEIKSEFAKVYDDMLLKEAKTADQKASIYTRQFNELSDLMANAKSDEEYLGYAKRFIDLSSQIQDSYKEEAEKMSSRIWTSTGGVKAMTAGSADAASIQNKLYNTSQRKIEQNTQRMVQATTVMNQLLGKINSRQEDGYEMEVVE